MNFEVTISRAADTLYDLYGIKYNVQVFAQLTNGDWYYCGQGKYCRTLKEAQKAKESFEEMIELTGGGI